MKKQNTAKALLLALFSFIFNSKVFAQVQEYRKTQIDSAVFASNRKSVSELKDDKFYKKLFSKNGVNIPYRILTPKNHLSTQKFPLVITLHNSSRVGSDNEKQLEHLARIWIRDSIYSKYQCYVLAPQFGKRSSIYEENSNGIQVSKPSKEVFALLSLIKSIEKENPDIDKNRIYLIGYSMGGSTAQNLMSIKPSKFAALVSVAAIPDLSNIKKISQKNIWLIHGEKDDDNPCSGSVKLYTEMINNKNVVLTLFENLNHHNIVIPFLLTEEIPKWLFGKHK